ncbi:DUF3566 domain-containing protein [Blastococcus sp. SYSU D00695]
MSDRTQGAVQTGTRPGEATDAPAGGPTATAPAAGGAPLAGGAPAGPATGASAATGPGAGPVAGGAPVTGTAPVTTAGAPGAGPGAGPVASSGSSPAGRTGPGRPAGGKGKARGPRRARLQLRHIDTWSALKISLVLSIALFFIWMVAVGILFAVLSGLGVFDTLNDLFGQLGDSGGDGAASEVITPGIVFGGAAVIGAINIVLMTALCTVAAFIYNMCSDLVGGLEVTLSERD